jgi:hypothetical protein
VENRGVTKADEVKKEEQPTKTEATSASKDGPATVGKPSQPVQTDDGGEKESGPCGLPKGCTIL